MAHTFKVSDFGMTLIKAYEGFRPVETSLVSGQRVIGYGHRFQTGEEPVVTREQAENLLKMDLSAYEDLVNHDIYAPLNQSQFDALVSLSFNIGPKAFLSSHVRHALNNGRPLEAASGFDQWCKSNIDGKIYVVDALVRRRTAEKALFLRAGEGIVSAPRHEIPPKQDHDMRSMEESDVVFDKHDAATIVKRSPYSAEHINVHIDKSAAHDEIYALTDNDISEHGRDLASSGLETDRPGNISEAWANSDPQSALSPIAIAAEEVSNRLDRLIADNTNEQIQYESTGDIDTASTRDDHSYVEDHTKDSVSIKAANEGTRDDYRRPANSNKRHVRAPDDFIHKTEPTKRSVETRSGFAAYWISLIIGAALLGGGIVKWFFMPESTIGGLHTFVAPLAALIGGMMVLGSLYYLAKTFVSAE